MNRSSSGRTARRWNRNDAPDLIDHRRGRGAVNPGVGRVINPYGVILVMVSLAVEPGEGQTGSGGISKISDVVPCRRHYRICR